MISLYQILLGFKDYGKSPLARGFLRWVFLGPSSAVLVNPQCSLDVLVALSSALVVREDWEEGVFLFPFLWVVVPSALGLLTRVMISS